MVELDRYALGKAARALAKAMMENQPIMTCYDNVVWHVPSLQLARVAVQAYQNAVSRGTSTPPAAEESS